MKRTLLKKYNTLISLLLSILGFGAACSLTGCEYGPLAVEYGTPHAFFKVNGNVKSEMTSTNLPNIRVVLGVDTAYTDEQGNYQVGTMDFPDDQAYLVEFKDIDGGSNGAYQPLDTIVEFIDPEFTGGSGGWDQGETEKELHVKLRDTE
ncbi:MAG: radical SAM-associated putative lipoprotein [Bacteroidales bacterium]|nr:radical SAM-associated putative lipoprotein [Bacteroidales bacterium]